MKGKIVVDVFEDGRAGMQVEGLDEWVCLRVLSALVSALTARITKGAEGLDVIGEQEKKGGEVNG